MGRVAARAVAVVHHDVGRGCDAAVATRAPGLQARAARAVHQGGDRESDRVLQGHGKGGTGLIGMWKAFEELETLGFIGSARPRMYAVQAEGCAPIVRAFDEGAEFAESWSHARTRAAGIRVPSALSDHLILDCLRRSGGAAVAVPETEIDSMQAFAAPDGAGYLNLESSAALAALPALLERRLISADERVALFDTGAGFKSEAASLERPAVVPNDPEAWS